MKENHKSTKIELEMKEWKNFIQLSNKQQTTCILLNYTDIFKQLDDLIYLCFFIRQPYKYFLQ